MSSDRTRLDKKMQRAFSVPMATQAKEVVKSWNSNGTFFPPMGPGQSWFVDSENGAATNSGKTNDLAVITIQAAITLATANNGDVIYVMPGHNEALSDSVLCEMSKAGVAIIGVGFGAQKPRIDFDHADAVFQITANDCMVKNIAFRASVTAVTVGVEIDGGVTGTIIDGCDWIDGEDGAGVDEFIESLEVEAACNNTIIRNCTFREHASAAHATSAIMLTGASDDVLIEGCEICGPYSTACITNDGAAQTNIRIRDCLLIPADTKLGIDLLTGSTGVIEDVRIASNLATLLGSLDADGCYFFNALNCEVVTETGGAIGGTSADD